MNLEFKDPEAALIQHLLVQQDPSSREVQPPLSIRGQPRPCDKGPLTPKKGETVAIV